MKTKEELIKLLKTDVDEFNEYRRNRYYDDTDLSGADFRGYDLFCANLSELDLRKVDLRGVNLRGADLYGVTINKSQIEDIVDSLIDHLEIKIGEENWKL